MVTLFENFKIKIYCRIDIYYLSFCIFTLKFKTWQCKTLGENRF